MKLMRATALAVGLALTVTLAPAAPAQAATARETYQSTAFAATNDHRANHGLVKLRKQACVQRYAVAQAKKMARAEKMFHQLLLPILNDCGLALVGENVAYGYRSGRAVVNDGWMKSALHRANILTPRFRLMGIGAAKGANGRWYVSQVLGRKLL